MMVNDEKGEQRQKRQEYSLASCFLPLASKIFLSLASKALLLLLVPSQTMAQRLDATHIMIDAETTVNAKHIYRTFQDAAARIADANNAEGITVYIRPGVYWIDDPDDNTVKIGENGREPFGMVLRCAPTAKLRLIGMGSRPEDVVLASQRGQRQGAVGNFTMFDIWCGCLTVEKLTMGNYCNVDLVYPKNPKLNRPRRSDAITQAHVGYVHGDSLVAKKVRFISRLNLNPLNGAKNSYYEDCHFECTDDALNGNATYRHCNFDLYGEKPFWSTFGDGALFVDCDFHVMGNNRTMYFCKRGGPVTVVNSRYHAPSDSMYIGWTAYPQRWLRCYQKGFTLNGKPYTIGNRQPQNTLTPDFLNDAMQRPPHLTISQHEATLRTGEDDLTLTAPGADGWRVEQGYEQYATLRVGSDGTAVVTPTNNTDETVDFCVVATTADGRESACLLTVKPSILPPPGYVKAPEIRQDGRQIFLDYELALEGRRDLSEVTWLRDGIAVSVTHNEPQRHYTLTKADVGHDLCVMMRPRHQRSNYGKAMKTCFSVENVNDTGSSATLTTDFHDFPCQWQPKVLPGFWTVDGYKPTDTAEFPWSFDSTKPMWEYGKGYNGAVGYGLLQAQRGARLMYTPVNGSYGDMHLKLFVDPTKTAGQGFGSATQQYMDVCLKFDTKTLTGYGLRIVRTTKHAKAVDFLLVRYDHGQVTPLTEPVASTCYRTNCTISVDFIGNVLTAHVETATPQPAESALAKQVDLRAEVAPNAFGGVHIQHTGTCGESTTMLHQLTVSWP